MTRIYLIRHGATALNRQVPYRLQGRIADPPLDDLGREQAERASAALAYLEIAAVYTSPLVRSLETAAIIARPHAIEPMISEPIIEADLGRWDGLTWDEAKDCDPLRFAEFQVDPGITAYPDGESYLDVQRRVTPALADLARRHPDERIIVVAHNLVNRAYLAGLLGLPIARARGLTQSNCGINVIDFEGENAVVATLNAAFHLDVPMPHGSSRKAGK